MRKVRQKKISTRFRNINLLLFALAFCVMAAVMLRAFGGVVREISADYAQRYAVSSAEALSARVQKEIGLMSKASRSDAVIDWLSHEQDPEKRRLAYGELSGIIEELYSTNLYINFDLSRNEYKIGQETSPDELRPVQTLARDNPDDNWYFACIDSDCEYLLDIGIDQFLGKKRVWLDYKVQKDGATIGVITTGLDFSHIIGELFAQYDNVSIRGFIIDAGGAIHIDSSLSGDDAYLHGDFESRMEDHFSDPAIPAAIQLYLDDIDGYFSGQRAPQIVGLTDKRFQYMTIAPIANTEWSTVILYDASSMINLTLFAPVFAVVLLLLITFALAIHAVGHRLIFHPLGKLDRSLALLGENREEKIFGLERNDELGKLSQTIHDLFTKANFDALTGIRNRRFAEQHFDHILKMLSRSQGVLSIIMLDVDFFKKYNDTYGHEQGDVCLRAVARALAASLTRSVDIAARYGGEEFIVILPNTDQKGACQIAGLMLENVRKLNMPHAGNEVVPYVTVSAGVTTGKALHGQSWEGYVKCADKALYLSKHNGRNRLTHIDYGCEEASSCV